MRTALSGGQHTPQRGETLGDLLRRVAYAQLPSRFYATLQIGLPLAYQFWQWDQPRLAGWSLVIAAFGLWGLSQQRLEGAAEGDVPRVARTRGVWRFARSVAAGAGGVIALGLVLEAFAIVLSHVFGCPGCAG